MEHPKFVGDRTTLAVMLGLQEAGYKLSTPFGENIRYDLTADDGQRVLRVQCKTGRLRDGAVGFSACSNYAHRRHGKSSQRDYLGQIDAFAVYCPETRGVYLIPINEIPVSRWGTLRVAPARNGQESGTRPALRYLIAEVDVVASGPKSVRLPAAA
jgi:hypothetical protein